jgi:DNA-3-methyladenine glycosylase
VIPGSGVAGASFPRERLAGDVQDAAMALVGAILVREPLQTGGPVRRGRIVEVEAYRGPDDAASHARMGRTPRNAPMFGPPGAAYLYLVYGMHNCLNVVAGPDGAPSAVLIRAVEPLEGVDAMRDARAALRRPAVSTARMRPDRLAAGPALVCACFGLDRSFNGIDLCDSASPVRLCSGDTLAVIAAGPRIGIAYAAEPAVSRPWRFADPNSPALSRPIA